MPFRPPRAIAARWRPAQGVGLQQVEVMPTHDGVRAEGVIIGGEGNAAYAVRFCIACDRAWVTRRLDLKTLDGRSLQLVSDGNGAWSEPGGRYLPAFDGCLDVDLEGSPFTNTLPIRRTGLPESGSVELTMLYVPFGTFAPTIDRQVYRCLEAATRYRYEAADGSFSAEITVDEDGLVIDYPPLFQRVPR